MKIINIKSQKDFRYKVHKEDLDYFLDYFNINNNYDKKIIKVWYSYRNEIILHFKKKRID